MSISSTGAFAATWKLSLGAEVSEGDYGTGIDSRLTYLPVSLTARQGDWRFKLSGGQLALRDRFDDGVTPTRTASGAADTLLGLTYMMPRPLPGAIYADLGIEYKWPTADESAGLGTGEADRTARVELFKRLGRWTGSAAIGYRWVGDPPDRDLRDRRQYSLGLSRATGTRTSIGISLDYRSALSDSGRDILELVPYAGWRLDQSWHLSAYAIAGLEDGSPDSGLGVQLGYQWQ